MRNQIFRKKRLEQQDVRKTADRITPPGQVPVDLLATDWKTASQLNRHARRTLKKQQRQRA